MAELNKNMEIDDDDSSDEENNDDYDEYSGEESSCVELVSDSDKDMPTKPPINSNFPFFIEFPQSETLQPRITINTKRKQITFNTVKECLLEPEESRFFNGNRNSIYKGVPYIVIEYKWPYNRVIRWYETLGVKLKLSVNATGTVFTQKLCLLEQCFRQTVIGSTRCKHHPLEEGSYFFVPTISFKI
jgi:hypothetical protein